MHHLNVKNMLAGVCGILVFCCLDCVSVEHTRITTSASGHYATYAGRTLMLIGESGTQCVTQNANLDYRSWIDDCAARGIPMVHVWSFMSPRQKQDGSLIEERWGYVYPGLTPWARTASGPPAADQLPAWDLQTFDDGPDDDLSRYWPRMRDLCRHAKAKGLAVGITVFTGWAKHPEDWIFHPLNKQNGGHLTNVGEAVLIESPGTEIAERQWSELWPNPRKTQWVWERLSDELIKQLNPFGNVFFVFLDEHSYDEGNMGQHFLDFFRKRGAVWVDWDPRRKGVDFVYSDTFTHDDKNGLAVKGFGAQPARPYLLLEGEPYRGDGVRTSIWTFAMGGGHYTFHADTGQETPQTGIMGYDPHVPGGNKGTVNRDWLGHASRFFNEHLQNLDQMAPHNELADADTCCLACPGVEYAVYSKRGAPECFHLDLHHATDQDFSARFYDPVTGKVTQAFTVRGGSAETFTKPDSRDWALHLTTCPK